MKALDYWRLCDELTIIQAALLISGQDPGDYFNIENWDNSERPVGYEAVKHALVAAVRSRRIKCRIITNFEVIQVDPDKAMGEAYLEPLPEIIDIERSFLHVESLHKWLMEKGITEGFFFPPNLPKIDFLNPGHPRYASKLAAAVNAWRATPNGDYLKNKSPKQALMKWLNEHAHEYGLTDDEGKPNETGITEIAKVANWAPGGGAPKTAATGSPDEEFSRHHDFDDEIPF